MSFPERTPKAEFARFLSELGLPRAATEPPRPSERPAPPAAGPKRPLAAAPAPISTSEWLRRLTLALDSSFATAFTGTPAEKTHVFTNAREKLLSLVDKIDQAATRLALVVPTACPLSCPSLPTPTPAHTTPSADKSVMTDPLPEPMAIDPPASVPRSYASVAVGAPATPAGSKNVATLRPNPKGLGVAPPRSAGPPVRLIVRPDPAYPAAEFPFAPLFVKGPSEPFRVLSHALSLSPFAKAVKLLGVHQNRNKNLVVSFPAGTPDAIVTDVTPLVRSTIGNLVTRIYPGTTYSPVVDRDIPWSKLLVSSVPARPQIGSPTYPEADLWASFLLNPSVGPLKITRAPRWIRNPASISGIHSSFTFSFEDPDGSISRQLAKSSLFVFGAPVHLKRWIDKPLATRREDRRRKQSGA